MSEIFIVDSHSVIGEQVNPVPIITASRMSDMASLGRADFDKHPVGFFVTEGLGKLSLPVGYIGCKYLFPPTSSSKLDEEHAMIGSQYLAEQFRGLRVGDGQQKLSTVLVEMTTPAVFDRFPTVTTCVAKCGEISTSSFVNAGYKPGAKDVKTGKTEHSITRPAS